MSLETSRSRPYLPALDGLRGFGIVFVVGYHFIRIANYDETLVGFSWIWMQMFFVLSGFLITEILLLMKGHAFGTYATQFYWRRSLRIFPLYFGYLFAAAVSYGLLGRPYDLPERAPYLITFTNNMSWLSPDLELISVWFVHFWSLAVEEQFYIVWALVVFLLSAPKLRALVIALVVLVPIFRYAFVSWLIAAGYPTPGAFSYTFTISQFDAFATGAAIPLFNLGDRVARPSRWIWLSGGLLFIGGLANLIVVRSSGVGISWTSLGIPFHGVDNLQHVWSYTLANALFMFTVLYLARRDYRGVLNHPFLVKTGKISYAIYVLHMLVLVGVWRFNLAYIHNTYVAFVLGCAITWAAAWVSYHGYEKRFLTLKDFWWTRRPRADVHEVRRRRELGTPSPDLGTPKGVPSID